MDTIHGSTIDLEEVLACEVNHTICAAAAYWATDRLLLTFSSSSKGSYQLNDGDRTLGCVSVVPSSCSLNESVLVGEGSAVVRADRVAMSELRVMDEWRDEMFDCGVYRDANGAIVSLSPSTDLSSTTFSALIMGDLSVRCNTTLLACSLLASPRQNRINVSLQVIRPVSTDIFAAGVIGRPTKISIEWTSFTPGNDVITTAIAILPGGPVLSNIKVETESLSVVGTAIASTASFARNNSEPALLLISLRDAVHLPVGEVPIAVWGEIGVTTEGCNVSIAPLPLGRAFIFLDGWTGRHCNVTLQNTSTHGSFAIHISNEPLQSFLSFKEVLHGSMGEPRGALRSVVLLAIAAAGCGR